MDAENREYYYLSSAKLDRWTHKEMPKRENSAETSLALSIPGVTAAAGMKSNSTHDEGSLQQDHRRLEQAKEKIEQVQGIKPIDAKNAIDINHWVYFSGKMRYGSIHHDKETHESASRKIVFFIGEAKSYDGPISLMLGGWTGHMREAYMPDRSTRMGSAREHIFKLWSEVIDAEGRGDPVPPEDFRRLERKSDIPGHSSPAESLIELYEMLDRQLPDSTAGEIEGVAEILAPLPGDGQRLILGSPLYVANGVRASPPEKDSKRWPPKFWHR